MKICELEVCFLFIQLCCTYMLMFYVFVAEDSISSAGPCAAVVYAGWITHCCKQKYGKSSMES